MRRRASLALIASIAGSVAASRSARAATLGTIRIAGPPTEDATPLYYGVKTGMFGRAGIEIEMIATASGTAATTAVIAGVYDMSRTSLTSVFIAFLRGIPVAIVAPENMFRSSYPNALLEIAADAPYKTGADLNGKTIGSPALNDFNVLSTKAWVDRNGGDWRSLKFVEIPNSALAASLVSHRIDAAILQTVQLDTALATGMTKTLGDAQGAIAPVFLAGAYMSRRDWADGHAELLRAYNHVLDEASAYVNTHFAETAPYVAEFTKIELADVRKMHRTYSATSLDPALLQPVIDAAAKYGHIPRSFAAREIFWT